VQLISTGGVRGVIARRVLLGDTIDYRVTVGGQEVRVQQSVRRPLFDEGQACGLAFDALHWYDSSGARVNG
jgi:hypothetical protein